MVPATGGRGFLGDECEGVFVEGAAGEVGWLGEAVGEVRDRVHAAADAVRHGAGLAAKRWPAIDRVVFGGCPDCHSDERQVEHRGGQHGGVTVVAAGQATHHGGCARSIVLRPPICRISVIDVDSAGEFFDLAFERNRAPAVPLADFKAKQFAIPPAGFSGV